MRPTCHCSVCERGRAIAAAEQNMDSPNTRSRTKRALEEDTGSGIEWKHDQDLRREVLRAAEGGEYTYQPAGLPRLIYAEHIELPAPTQKPRPAVSSLALSPSQIAPSASYRSGEPSTLGPRRKRPCRSTKLTTNGDVQVSRASTAPSGSTPGSGRGLKAILDRFAEVDINQTQVDGAGTSRLSPSATLTSANHSPTQPGVLSPRSLNAQGVARSPLAQRSSTKIAMPLGSSSKSTTSPNHTITRQPAPLARQTSSRSSIASNPPQTPKSPLARNNGPAPRIGLRGNTSTPAQPPKPHAQLPFKPPLMNQAIRSSPRRQAPLPTPAEPTSSSRSASNRKSTRTPSRPSSVKPPRSRSSPGNPSSDDVGDDSFDWDEAMQDPKLVGMVDGK